MQSLNYKRITLIGATVASSTIMWAVARAWLGHTDRFTSMAVMIWPALAFALAGAVAGVAFVLQEHWVDRLAAMLASWATFIFFWAPDIWYVSALPVFILFWWQGARYIRHDLGDRRKLRIPTMLGQGMKLIVLGCFLMVSLGFYLLPSSKKINVNTVSGNVRRSVENAYDNPLIEQQIAQLPAGSQSQFRQDVGRAVDETVRAWLTPIRQFIPPILAFGLFLALWSLNFIVRIPAIWLGECLFLLLKYTGFVRVSEKEVKAEIITL